MPDPVRIAVSNQKGGVGKTAVAINVAGALNDRGEDVLFVDLDPQGNATENLGMREAYDEPPPSLFDVLSDVEQRGAITELVRDHEEMDVIPSNIDMTAVEPELTLSRRSGQQLSLALEQIDHRYDYSDTIHQNWFGPPREFGSRATAFGIRTTRKAAQQ